MYEGNYTNWAIYDRFLDADVNNTHGNQTASINEAETMALIIDAANICVKTYTISTKTLSGKILDDVQYPYGLDTEFFGFKSTYGTYMVFLWTTGVSPINCDRLSVVKDGVVIKTFTDADLDMLKIRTASISPKGKWIFCSGWLVTEANVGWVVLQGS